jgi:hypothetical protein
MSDCTLANNSAIRRGGGVCLNFHNHIILLRIELVSNSAGDCGGGLASVEDNTLDIISSRLSSNTAGKGGALCLLLNLDLTFSSNNTLSDNRAGTVGGGVALFAAPLWCNLGYLVLLRNSAERGSALYFKDVVTEEAAVEAEMGVYGVDVYGGYGGYGVDVEGLMQIKLHEVREVQVRALAAEAVAVAVAAVAAAAVAVAEEVEVVEEVFDRSLTNLYIEQNVASVGGTVYWVLTSTMPVEPAGLRSGHIHWGHNSAPYGAQYATQAVGIAGPLDYLVSTYGGC